MLLREVRDRLNADLQREYGVCLTDMYEGRVNVLDVADFAANLPRGGAVSAWYGGWGAVTSLEESLRRVEHVLKLQMVQASGKKRSIPDPAPPKSLRDAHLRAREKEDRLARVRRDALAYRK